MSEEMISSSLIKDLRESKSATAIAIANDLSKVNQIASLDPEMAIVRIRRALDLILRNISIHSGLNPGTKPLENLLVDLKKQKTLDGLIERHCRVIKEFGNYAAHGPDDCNCETISDSITETEVLICSNSISLIAKWYLKSINDNKVDNETYEIVSGTAITHHMIDQSINIDCMNYPADYRGIKEFCYKWHERNPHIYTMVLDPVTRDVVGYINAMPLDVDYFMHIKKGNTIDVEIPPDKIRQYNLPDFYSMYFASIAIHPSYQSTKAFIYLYEGFIKNLTNLAREEIFISEITADAITPEGMRLCKYVGMKEVCKTNHDSFIYSVSLLPPSLRITTSAGKTLVAFYKKKYDEFKDIIDLSQNSLIQ